MKRRCYTLRDMVLWTIGVVLGCIIFGMIR